MKNTYKTFVKISDNACESYLQDHIKPGDNVIVVDGSYMAAKDNSTVYGIQFRRNGHIGDSYYELLTVKTTNQKRLNTSSHVKNDTLRYHNNCVIVDHLGNEYYCSIVNIRRYKVQE